MKNSKTIIDVVKKGLCQGCGICAGVCPKKAITITIKGGVYTPAVEKNICISCGLCKSICSGYGVNLKETQEQIFISPSLLQDYYIGRYESIYAAFSNEREIRYHGASGGMVTQFLIYLLESKLIDGAIVSKLDEKRPLEPVTFLAKTREEIISGKSSLYCPVSFHNVTEIINRESGKYVIVGLPCHIQALRKYSKINTNFSSKIFGYFALYCGSTRNFISQDYLLWRYGKRGERLTRFTYRDDGCLGYAKIYYQSGENLKVPFLEYYSSMRGFFTPVRCTLCMDHYGELGDVCFGDIHMGKYKQDTVGTSSLIIRNKKFNELFEDAQNKGFVSIEKIDADILNQSQAYVKVHKKGSGLKTAYILRKIFGQHNPVYNFAIKDAVTPKSIVRYFAHVISRRIGLVRKFWIIIPVIDRIALRLKLGLRRRVNF